MAPLMDEGEQAQPHLQYPAPLDAARGAAINVSQNDSPDITTPVLIVGGGPVGMLQALIFARLHQQPCVVVEREPTTTIYPKMEYTNSRSMEIYRMMGLAEEFRALGTKEVPEEYDNNELIVTSLAEGGRLIHVWERDGAKQQREKSAKVNDGSLCVEPHLRCHQIIVEKWLKEKVEAEKLIRSFWGVGFVGLEERGDCVLSEMKKVGSGEKMRVKSEYVIGCDGGGSWVRKSAGLESKRNYLDMSVAFLHLRSQAIREALPFGRFWHCNVIGGGLLVSQNEKDVWTVHLIAPPGVDPSTFSAEDILALTWGGCLGPKPIAYDEIYCRGVWKVDVAIANKFRSDGGRVFLAGDAAHQLSPVGGHGLNSGLGDAFDLAWKLSARMKEWGGEALLTSYDVERRQIAFENLGHVTRALETIVGPVFGSAAQFGPDVVNGDGKESDATRRQLDEICQQGHWLHDQNGNILGYSYKDSPAIVESGEKGERPKGTDEIYVPTTFPGSQAPRLWLKDSSNTADSLSSTSFNLVDFSEDGSLSTPFVTAANELTIPLNVVQWKAENDNVRKVFERDLVLVRPDTHVAWRSEEGGSAALSQTEAARILTIACGRSTIP